MALPQKVYLLSLFVFSFHQKRTTVGGSKLACVEGWNEQRIWTLREVLHSFCGEVYWLASLSLVYTCVTSLHMKNK